MNITFTNYQKDDFFALQPIEWSIKADEKNVDTKKATRWYPKLFLIGLLLQ
jgi:hypothetical protein